MHLSFPRLLLTCLALMLGLHAAAQAPGVVISDETNPAPADSSALLEVRSTGTQRQGFLLPRMTQAQREAILKPAQGLMVFQTAPFIGVYVFTGTQWVLLTPQEVPAALAISSVTPTVVRPGDTLFVVGTGFSGTTTFALGTEALAGTLSGNQLVATVPALAPGFYVVRAENNLGLGGVQMAQGADTVQVLGQLPIITLLAPTSGEAGTLVAVVGSNFGAVSELRFNGAAISFNRPPFNAANDSLLFNAPALPAGSYTVSVVDNRDEVFAPELFTIVVPDTTPVDSNTVNLLAGTPGLRGNTDGPFLQSTLNFPTGIAFEPIRNRVYFSQSRSGGFDAGIRFLDLNSDSVKTLAIGSTFNFPSDVEVDNQGNVYTADFLNNSVIRVTPFGATSSINFGVTQNFGLEVHAPTYTLYMLPVDTRSIFRRNLAAGINLTPVSYANSPIIRATDLVRTDTSVFIIDQTGHCIYRVDTAFSNINFPVLVAGQPNVPGNSDGIGSNARFNGPTFATLSTDGRYLLVGDQTSGSVRKVDISSGEVTTLGSQGEFSSVHGVTQDPTGLIYVPARADGVIKTIE